MAMRKWFDEIGQIIGRVEQSTKGDENDRSLAEIVFRETSAHVDGQLKKKKRVGEPPQGWREKTIARFAAIVAMSVKALREQVEAYPEVGLRPLKPVKPKIKVKAKTKSKTKRPVAPKARPKVKARSAAKRKSR